MRSVSLALFVAMAPTALAQACSGLELVYARATGEPAAKAGKWSKGYGAAGYSLFTNLTALVPGSTGYAVNYPAAMGTENKGAQDMTQHIRARAKACPQQKYALGGHSQGGFAVDIAVRSLLGPELLPKVIAITMFGGKPCPPSVKELCISYCNKTDGLCSRFDNSAAHVRRADPVSALEKRYNSEMMMRPLPSCPEALKIKTVGGGNGGHMDYNKDGLLVKAAACFIAARYKNSSGK